MKGMAEETIYKLVLAVIALVGIGWLFFTYGPSLMNFITGKLQEFLNSAGGSEVDAINLKAAIECSYYRCKEGCDSKKVASIQWSDDSGQYSCKEDFCSGSWVPTDKKVCGNQAKLYPVQVSLENEVSIDRNKILVTEQKVQKNFDIYVIGEDCENSNKLYLVSTGRPIIFVPINSLEEGEPKVSCEKHTPLLDSYFKCRLMPGDYYIFSEEFSGLNAGHFATTFCTQPYNIGSINFNSPTVKRMREIRDNLCSMKPGESRLESIKLEGGVESIVVKDAGKVPKKSICFGFSNGEFCIDADCLDGSQIQYYGFNKNSNYISKPNWEDYDIFIEKHIQEYVMRKPITVMRMVLQKAHSCNSLNLNDCQLFCKDVCAGKYSRCECLPSRYCQVSCDCYKTTRCQDYEDDLACLQNGCGLPPCHWDESTKCSAKTTLTTTTIYLDVITYCDGKPSANRNTLPPPTESWQFVPQQSDPLFSLAVSGYSDRFRVEISEPGRYEFSLCKDHGGYSSFIAKLCFLDYNTRNEITGNIIQCLGNPGTTTEESQKIIQEINKPGWYFFQIASRGGGANSYRLAYRKIPIVN